MELAIIEFEPIVKQSGLEKAEQYAAIFSPFMITLKQLSDKAASVNKENPTALDAKIAREVRLSLVKNRTATGKQKDVSKATLMAETSLIQNLHNVVINSSQLVEADLEAVEKYAENKEKERKAALQIERAAMFNEYNTDLTGYDLGNMAENVFSDLLESQKLLHEKRIADAAALEAKRIADEKAELERQAALKAENERLKAEADKAAAALEAERAEVARLAKIEVDKQAAILKEQQEKAAAEAKANAEKLAAIEAANKAAREKAAAELKAAQDAAAKAAKELQAKKDAEAKEAQRLAAIESQKKADEKKAALAPKKTKMKLWVDGFVMGAPIGMSNDPAVIDILAKFASFKTWALQQIESL
jgi:hypothetical protein